ERLSDQLSFIHPRKFAPPARSIGETADANPLPRGRGDRRLMSAGRGSPPGSPRAGAPLTKDGALPEAGRALTYRGRSAAFTDLRAFRVAPISVTSKRTRVSEPARTTARRVSLTTLPSRVNSTLKS